MIDYIDKIIQGNCVDESDVKNEVKLFGEMLRNMIITLEALKYKR